MYLNNDCIDGKHLWKSWVLASALNGSIISSLPDVCSKVRPPLLCLILFSCPLNFRINILAKKKSENAKLQYDKT